jgi:hypothetical protein
MTIFDDIKRRVTLADLLGTTEKRIRCPVHQDNHPSCDLDHDLNLWHCKACDAGGDVFSLLEQRDGLSRAEALKELANRAGVALTPQAQADAEQARTLEEQIQAQRWAMVRHYQETLFQHQQALGTLMGRGFSEKTLREMHVGYADASNRFEGNSYFDSRFIFPMVIRGRVEQISGRLAPWNPSPQKYLHLKGVDVAHFYNQDAITDTIWVFEGHPDTLSGVEIGLPAVGVVGTSGMQHPERFKRCKQIYICPDNDPAGAKAAEKWVAAMLGAGVKADILLVSLPAGVKDFNEWFLANRGEGLQGAFDALRNGAKPPINWKIDRLTSAADLEGLWPYLQPLTETQRREVFSQIKAKLSGVGMTTLEKDFNTWRKSVEVAKGEDFRVSGVTYSPAEMKTLNVGFDTGVKGGVAHVCVYGQVTRVNEEGQEVVRQEPVLIRSTALIEEGQPLRYTASETVLADAGIPVTNTVPFKMVIDGRGGAWSDASVHRFLTGQAQPMKTGDLVRRIAGLFRKYIWYRDPINYEMLAVYTLGTYVARIFGAYPYLCVNGLKRTGKSNTLELLHHLCFNSVMAASITISSTFRIIQSSFCTWIRDEAEQFNQRNEDNLEELTILNAGYKEGGFAVRNEKTKDGGFEPTQYQVFSPKVFGGINITNSVLLDRSILLKSHRASQDIAGTLPSFVQHREEWTQEAAAIRDELYVWMMTQFPRVRGVFKEYPASQTIFNREWELWLPLMTLAYLADEDDGFPDDSFTGRLGELAKKKAQEKKEIEQEESPELKTLESLATILEGDSLTRIQFHPHWYQLNELAKKVTEEFKQQGYYKDSWEMSPRRLMKILEQTQVIGDRTEETKLIKIGAKPFRCVQLTAEKVAEAIDAM